MTGYVFIWLYGGSYRQFKSTQLQIKGLLLCILQVTVIIICVHFWLTWQEYSTCFFYFLCNMYFRLVIFKEFVSRWSCLLHSFVVSIWLVFVELVLNFARSHITHNHDRSLFTLSIIAVNISVHVPSSGNKYILIVASVCCNV